MTLEDLILPIALSGGAASAITFVAWRLFTRYYVPVPPNRALILFGRRSSAPGAGHGSGPGAVELRIPRILVGGGAFVPPWRKGADFLSLEPIDVDVTVRVASAGGGSSASGLEARISLQVKIPAEPSMLRAAAENLLGKSEEDIRKLVVRTVEGATPPLLVRIALEEPTVDWERLAAEIQASVARDLVDNGLVIRNLALKDLRRLPESVGAMAGRVESSVRTPEVLWTPEDTSVRLDALESRLGRTGRNLTGLGAKLLRTPPAAEVLLPDPQALSPYDPTGSDLPSRPPGPPESGAFEGGSGRRRSPWDAKP